MTFASSLTESCRFGSQDDRNLSAWDIIGSARRAFSHTSRSGPETAREFGVMHLSTHGGIDPVGWELRAGNWSVEDAGSESAAGGDDFMELLAALAAWMFSEPTASPGAEGAAIPLPAAWMSAAPAEDPCPAVPGGDGVRMGALSRQVALPAVEPEAPDTQDAPEEVACVVAAVPSNWDLAPAALAPLSTSAELPRLVAEAPCKAEPEGDSAATTLGVTRQDGAAAATTQLSIGRHATAPEPLVRQASPPVAFALELEPRGEECPPAPSPSLREGPQTAAVAWPERSQPPTQTSPQAAASPPGHDVHDAPVMPARRLEAGPGLEAEDDKNQRGGGDPGAVAGAEVPATSPGSPPPAASPQPASAPSAGKPPLDSTAALPPADVAPQPLGPARELRLRLEGHGATSVDVRVAARQGGLRVEVRTADTDLSNSLRRDLSGLVDRLEQAGFRTEPVPRSEAIDAGPLLEEPSSAKHRAPEGSPGDPRAGDWTGRGSPHSGDPGEQQPDRRRTPFAKRARSSADPQEERLP